MKATELRIGNYLHEAVRTKISRKIVNFELMQMDSLNIHHLEKFPESISFKPIPLTEEWLVKFGFKQISERVYIKNYHYGYEFGITNIFIIKNDNCFMRYKHIQHVHELQNLYFALTGEELTI